VTTTEAIMFTNKVKRKSTRPAARSDEIPSDCPPEPKRSTMRAAIELAPPCRRCGEIVYVSEMMIETTTVSPSLDNSSRR
jgi:hypothetical protein